MPRIELLMSVIAGMSGGLAGLVWSRLVSARWLQRAAGVAVSPDTIARQVAAAALFAAGGAALGLLYWLGWGLISLVNVRWYEAGLLFGVLAWSGIALPLIGAVALRLRGRAAIAGVLTVEWLVTCLAVGLSCALAWHGYM